MNQPSCNTNITPREGVYDLIFKISNACAKEFAREVFLLNSCHQRSDIVSEFNHQQKKNNQSNRQASIEKYPPLSDIIINILLCNHVGRRKHRRRAREGATRICRRPSQCHRWIRRPPPPLCGLLLPPRRRVRGGWRIPTPPHPPPSSPPATTMSATRGAGAG